MPLSPKEETRTKLALSSVLHHLGHHMEAALDGFSQEDSEMTALEAWMRGVVYGLSLAASEAEVREERAEADTKLRASGQSAIAGGVRPNVR